MSNLTSIYSGNETLQMNPDDLCTPATCDLTLTHFNYLPSLSGNALYAALFCLFIVGQLYLGIRYRTWGFMVAMTWGPGQGTPIHDHAGIWCVEGVIQGEMTVTSYQVQEQKGDLYRFIEVEKVKAMVQLTSE